MRLEYGPTYELTQPLITSKLNSAGADLEDDGDPMLPAGTRFIVCDWNSWAPGYSEQLKKIGKDPYFYGIELKTSVHGAKR